MPITITAGENVADGVGVLGALFAAAPSLRAQLIQHADPKDPSTDAERSVDVLLAGGNDGHRPTATEYEGTADPTRRRRRPA